MDTTHADDAAHASDGTPYRDPPRFSQPAAPFEAQELGAAAFWPHRAIDLVLVDRPRLARTIGDSRHLGRLGGLLLFASVIFSLPYAAVFGLEHAFRVALLLLGSVAICLPSLHVFASYLGSRISLAQNVVATLVLSAVASMFAMAFAPIVWFVRVTTQSDSSALAPVALALLAIAVLAGLVHLGRTLFDEGGPSSDKRYRFTLFGWQLLFIWVAYRMAVVLGLA